MRIIQSQRPMAKVRQPTEFGGLTSSRAASKRSSSGTYEPVWSATDEHGALAEELEVAS
jgi:hypothetical protein